MMLLPRESVRDKECIRLYCPAPKNLGPNHEANIEDVIDMIHDALRPYTITWEEINWFTIYRVGQRIASKFDVKQKIFLAGDASHIHSPKGKTRISVLLFRISRFYLSNSWVRNEHINAGCTQSRF